jgi:hypothetical protein
VICIPQTALLRWVMYGGGGEWRRIIIFENKMVRQNNCTRIVIKYISEFELVNLSLCLLGTFTLSKHTTPLRKLFAFLGKVPHLKTETCNPETSWGVVCCNERKRLNKCNWQNPRETTVTNLNDSFRFNLLWTGSKDLPSSGNFCCHGRMSCASVRLALTAPNY